MSQRKLLFWSLILSISLCGTGVIYQQYITNHAHFLAERHPHTPVKIVPKMTPKQPHMTLAPGVPQTLVIPALGITAPVAPVGIDRQGEMTEPSDAHGVTWYKQGYMPGTMGNAVFAGHYTWLGKPGVFHDLTKLVVGDAIEVTNDQKQRLRFTVSSTEHFLTESAPGEAIFGKSDTAQLKLITCYGHWNHNAQQYQERYIVTARYTSETVL